MNPVLHVLCDRHIRYFTFVQSIDALADFIDQLLPDYPLLVLTCWPTAIPPLTIITCMPNGLPIAGRKH